jgi:hypothetical protein
LDKGKWEYPHFGFVNAIKERAQAALPDLQISGDAFFKLIKFPFSFYGGFDKSAAAAT